MSLHETFPQDLTTADAGVAANDFAAAFRLSPEQMWRAPANTNTKPISLEPALKRALDLIIALPMLVFCAPLLIALALIVRLDSKGPALFRQTRLGQGGKAFDIFKFRTMTVMENGDSVVQATAGDLRVTKSGRWLRASSLDELPQLLNVIKGDMSLVGPRPHARAHDTHFAGLISNYTLRQDVKPGITGWAQIHGHRGETPTTDAMRARVDLDIFYAKNVSVVLDLTILAKTPFAVLSARNAR
ncbi:MAG TPA: sugar transferase [Rhizomicrobium sp.]|jgi:exopolysaccharide biosynthesis polyprenyl glycosylphosphotransferase|nr:sugar transferase [Rhizomicrobium sp.]